jgi:hypothetical protein
MPEQSANGDIPPQPPPPPAPPTPDQLSRTEKYVAGVLLVIFIAAPVLFIIAHWPDRIPGPKDSFKSLYINEPFHVRLALVPESCRCLDTFFINDGLESEKQAVPKIDIAHQKNATLTDSAKKADSTTRADSAKRAEASKVLLKSDSLSPLVCGNRPYYLISDLLDLNILVLLLVAAGGFLGNMIYVATSFTTFIGSNKFNRRWLLWYIVKPFTAAALALALYFVFRGGFLNYAADASGINLYGVLTIAILAGLFTDKATLKLKEVFDVIFTLKKDDRPNALVPATFKFNTATPAKLSATGNNSITITGENFDKGTLIFKMNDQLLPPGSISKTATVITLSYTVPAAPPALTQITLVVTDEHGTAVFKQIFSVA